MKNFFRLVNISRKILTRLQRVTSLTLSLMRTTSTVASFAALAVALTSPVLATSASANPTTTTAVAHTNASSVGANGLLTLNLLSGGKPQALSTPSGDAFFSIYVPARTIPKEFVASLLIRGPVTGGIATITTPTNVFPQDLKTVNGTTTFSAPLTSADDQNGVVTIHVHVDLNLSSKYLNPSGCTTPDSVVAQIETAKGILGGVIVTPKTPADFWPPILNRVVVWVPPLSTLSPADARAASLASMQVAATIAQQYGTATEITYAEGEPAPQSIDPTVRNVVIHVATHHQPSEIVVRSAGTAPVLELSGSAAALVNEARSISKTELALATAKVATNFSAHPSSKSPSVATLTPSGARQLTLAQLGAQTSIEGLGTVDVLQGLSQSQFGAPISSLQLRLQANYSVPPVGGVASFSVLVGNYILASQRLTTLGSLSMVANVPTSVLNRSQSVDFRLNYSPPGGYCHAGLVPVQVTIDPASGFSARSGQTLPPGFARSPQDVAPGFNVNLVSLNDQNLIEACELVTSLAQILPQPPVVNLVSPAALTSGNETEIVVGAGRTTTMALKAPIVLQPFRTLASSGLSVGYSVHQPFAVLESFVQNGRDVILSGAYQENSLAKSMLAQVATTSFGGWFALGTGQIAIMTSDQHVRFVGAGSVLSQLTPSNPANNLGIPTWLLALIALIILLVVLRFLWFALKMSRLRRLASAKAQDTMVVDEDDESDEPDEFDEGNKLDAPIEPYGGDGSDGAANEPFAGGEPDETDEPSEFDEGNEPYASNVPDEFKERNELDAHRVLAETTHDVATTATPEPIASAVANATSVTTEVAGSAVTDATNKSTRKEKKGKHAKKGKKGRRGDGPSDATFTLWAPKPRP